MVANEVPGVAKTTFPSSEPRYPRRGGAPYLLGSQAVGFVYEVGEAAFQAGCLVAGLADGGGAHFVAGSEVAQGGGRNLEREVDTTMIVVEHEDGTTSRFREEDVFPGAFMHEMGRMRHHHDGDEPGPAHPFIVALRSATNLDRLIAEQGTMVGHLLGENEIMRGVRERPGPPVKWNDEGTVCD